MQYDELTEVMEEAFTRVRELREAGQKEYARGQDVFGNFNRAGMMLRLDRKKVLFVYAAKHFDGIASYIDGHKSQREHVKGRIFDMIVYMLLLYGMVVEEEKNKPSAWQQLKEAVWNWWRSLGPRRHLS